MCILTGGIPTTFGGKYKNRIIFMEKHTRHQGKQHSLKIYIFLLIFLNWSLKRSWIYYLYKKSFRQDGKRIVPQSLKTENNLFLSSKEQIGFLGDNRKILFLFPEKSFAIIKSPMYEEFKMMLFIMKVIFFLDIP